MLLSGPCLFIGEPPCPGSSQIVLRESAHPDGASAGFALTFRIKVTASLLRCLSAWFPQPPSSLNGFLVKDTFFSKSNVLTSHQLLTSSSRPQCSFLFMKQDRGYGRSSLAEHLPSIRVHGIISNIFSDPFFPTASSGKRRASLVLHQISSSSTSSLLSLVTIMAQNCQTGFQYSTQPVACSNH